MANFFFMKKNDGKLRPVQDYRPLNKWTKKNYNISPLITSTINQLYRCILFTKFSIRWGYNNIWIKGNKWKVAFLTPEGLFKPKVMFSRLTNSSAMFQIIINIIFCNKVVEGQMLVYMDNIAIHTKPKPREMAQQYMECHRRHTYHMLDKLKKKDLFLKLEKCAFKQEEINYLGIIIGKGKLCMNLKKLKGVADWPTLKTPTCI